LIRGVVLGGAIERHVDSALAGIAVDFAGRDRFARGRSRVRAEAPRQIAAFRDGSMDQMRVTPDSFKAAMVSRPMGPAPNTAAVSPVRILAM